MEASLIFLLLVSAFAGSSRKTKEHHAEPYDQVSYENENENEETLQPKKEDNDSEFQEALKQLGEMGFDTRDQVLRNALQDANNDVHSAIDIFVRKRGESTATEILAPSFPQSNVNRLRIMGFSEHDIRKHFPGEINDLNAALDVLLKKQNRTAESTTDASATQLANPLHLRPTTIFVTEDTECIICTEQFHERNKKPQVLTREGRGICRHFLCRECVSKIRVTKRECPYCRERFDSFRDALGIHEMTFDDLERYFGPETEWHPYQIAVLLKTRHFPGMADKEFVVIVNDLLSKIQQPKELTNVSKQRLRSQWGTIKKEIADEIAKRR